MRKIKVSRATNTQLDWLVATCEGLTPYSCVERDIGQQRPLYRWIGVNMSPSGHDVFSPTTDWSQMGPIIEREGIDVFTSYEGSFIQGSFAEQTGWAARQHTHGGPINPKRFLGETPLIAAARCYVMSKLGQEVEIPEELYG